MPGRPRNVEKLWKKRAKPAGCDHDLGHPALAEERLPELILIGDDLVRLLFVVGELADEVED
jgi:hypothetical protein